ncbi:MAG: zinc ribbon domain-containing protein, partial [Gammaproteobacteria bacterium]
AVFTGIAAWGGYFISTDFTANPFEIGRSFMHNVDLVFHEAGHVFFRPFGWFMMILGGTLGQWLMPAALAATFLIKYRNTFAASVCLWWLGQSFMDAAPYIDDALDQKLVLVGGHTGADVLGNHDWNNILGEFNALERHRDLATLVDAAGVVLMLAALAWGAVLLYRQYRRLA